MKKHSLFCVVVLFFKLSQAWAEQPVYLKLPEAASYQLPVISAAANGDVLTTEHQKLTLHELMADKIVLLSFIYSTCSDVMGCPLATAVFQQINRQLLQEPVVADHLRLLTLSFNPKHDTPELMKKYGGSFMGGLDWRFLTTASEHQLAPIMRHYQQNVQKVYDQEGRFTGTFSHLLRVYLIDKQKNIRNIYSVSFINPNTLISDVKTLIQEISSDSVQTSVEQSAPQMSAAQLLKNIKQPPLGLPIVEIGFPINAAKIELGRKLFFDRRLSFNNTFSCATCHIPEQGFTNNEMRAAVGIEGLSIRRNSPTLYNVAYAKLLFHDGRENSLAQQTWGPLLAQNEMGNPSIGHVLDKVTRIVDYQGLFEKSFGEPVNMINLGEALSAYQQALLSADSDFDRWYYGGEKDAISESAKRGFELFRGRAGCVACHHAEKEYALFMDNQLHNTGMGYLNSMQIAPDTIKIDLGGKIVEVAGEIVQSVAEPPLNDLGRYEITQQPRDRWKYKTPTLRNISLTAPYMHDGSLSSLEEVIDFYNQGGVGNENLDSLIQPLGLSKDDKLDLLDFLQSLTGSNVKGKNQTMLR